MDFLQRVTGLFEKLENHLASYEEETFRRFALLFYGLVATANILTHEMWRDELQASKTAARYLGYSGMGVEK